MHEDEGDGIALQIRTCSDIKNDSVGINSDELLLSFFVSFVQSISVNGPKMMHENFGKFEQKGRFMVDIDKRMFENNANRKFDIC